MNQQALLFPSIKIYLFDDATSFVFCWHQMFNEDDEYEFYKEVISKSEYTDRAC